MCNVVDKAVKVLAQIKLAVSNEVVILADSKKFGRQGLIKIDPVTEASAIITDGQIPDDYKAYLFQMGVKTFFSYDIKESNIREIENE